MAQPAFRYWAFISYSHADEKVARWLHRALETYRVPRRLVGRPHPDGGVPRRIFPIFRDRDELPSSAELGGVINAALEVSRHQIVICSPPAAASRWVNEEIKTFKAFGRESRVLALIIDGEPNASDQPKSGLLECFPPALRHRVDASGALTSERTEPIAADVRKGKDGRREALLKLISGLIGVNLDELKQREKVRQRWRLAGFAALTAAVVAMLGGVWQWQEQRRAEQARVERIARYLDLGRKELEVDQPARAATWLGAAYALGDRSVGLRYQLAKAMLGVDPLLRTFVQSETPSNNWTFASLSPDGSRVISGSNDSNVAIVWDAESGRKLMELDHGAWVGWVGYRPDGRLIFSSGERSVSLWDAASGARVAQFSGQAYPGAMLRAAFSPNSRRLFVRHADNAVHVHDAQSGAELAVLRDDGPMARTFVTSRDGDLVVTSKGSDVRIWSVPQRKVVATLPTRAGPVTHVDLSPDGNTLASVGDDGAVLLWNLAQRSVVSQLRMAGPSGILTFNPDGSRLALLGEDGSVSVWPMQTRALAAAARSLPSWWSADGAWIVAGYSANAFRLWSSATQRPWRAFGGHASAITVNRFAPGTDRILSSARDGTVRLWQPRFREQPLVRDTAFPIDAQYSADGKQILTLTSSGEINIRDARTGALVRSVRSSQAIIQNGELNRDGSRAWVLVRGAELELWDAASGKAVARLEGHHDEVPLSAAFDDSGRWVVTAEDRFAQLWDASDGRLVRRIEATQNDNKWQHWLAFSHDGGKLAIADGTPSVRIVDLATGRLERTLEFDGTVPVTVSWSSSGGLLAAADLRGTTRIWDPSTGRLVRTLDVGTFIVELAPVAGHLMAYTDEGPAWWNIAAGTSQLLAGHSAEVMFHAYSPDRTRIATASQDRTIRLWDAQSGQLLDILTGHANVVSRLDFSPDGERLLSTAYDDTIRQWDMVPLEPRSPQQIAAVLRCKSPWRIEGDGLVMARPGPGCFQ